MIDVHKNATLSESFEGDRSRVISNCCNIEHEPIIALQTQFSFKTCNILIDLTFVRIIPESAVIQQKKNSFLILRLLGRLLDLAEELPDSLHGFRIFIS